MFNLFLSMLDYISEAATRVHPLFKCRTD